MCIRVSISIAKGKFGRGGLRCRDATARIVARRTSGAWTRTDPWDKGLDISDVVFWRRPCKEYVCRERPSRSHHPVFADP